MSLGILLYCWSVYGGIANRSINQLVCAFLDTLTLLVVGGGG